MKCEQCGFHVDSLPEGGGEFLCPNCGWVMRKGAPGSPDDGKASPADATGTATHLKIAKTVNVGFGDFASVLAATDASKIVPTNTNRDLERTRTASSSSLNVAAPDDDDVLTPLDVYDEDDEYARIQADLASRKAALDSRAAELDAREKHLNKKLEEIISEKEFLRTGLEKNDIERASYRKQKDALDAQRSAMEKELAARKAALDARAAEIDRKNEALGKTRATLEELKRELDTSLTGDKPVGDGSSSSVSIPYSAKLLRQNNNLARTVRILNRIVICLGILAVILVVLLFVKESELKRARAVPGQSPGSVRTEAPAATSADAPEQEKLPAPENTSGGSL